MEGSYVGDWRFPGGSDGKESTCNTGDLGLIPWSGSLGEGNGYSLQYSCLENSMDRGAWQATAHAVTESQTGLSDYACTCRGLTVYVHMYILYYIYIHM